jgi:hypothetical protein
MVILKNTRKEEYCMKLTEQIIFVTHCIVLAFSSSLIQSTQDSAKPFTKFLHGIQKASQWNPNNPKPVTKAINSGQYETPYDLVESITKKIEGNYSTKLSHFIVMLHHENLSVKSFIQDFFKERYIQIISTEKNLSKDEAGQLWAQLETKVKPNTSSEQVNIKFNSNLIPLEATRMIGEIIKENKFFNNKTIEIIQSMGFRTFVESYLDGDLLIITLGLNFHLFSRQTQRGIIEHELMHAKKGHVAKECYLNEEKKQFTKKFSRLQEYEADLASATEGTKLSAECIVSTIGQLKTISDVFSMLDVATLAIMPPIIRELYLNPLTITTLFSMLLISLGLTAEAVKYYKSLDSTHPAIGDRYKNAKLVKDLLITEAKGLLGLDLD